MRLFGGRIFQPWSQTLSDGGRTLIQLWNDAEVKWEVKPVLADLSEPPRHTRHQGTTLDKKRTTNCFLPSPGQPLPHNYPARREETKTCI